MIPNNKVINIFITILSIGFSFIIHAQKFEGRIVYAVQMSDKKLISQTIYDTITVFIKGNNIKRLPSNVIFSSTSFVLGNNQFYVNESLKEIIYDISDTLGILREEKTNNLSQTKYKEKFINYQCQKYVLEENNTRGKDYIEFWINNKWGVDQSYSHFLMKDIGIVLKMVENAPNAKIVMIATEITPMKLDNKLFELPNYPIKQKELTKMAKALMKSN